MAPPSLREHWLERLRGEVAAYAQLAMDNIAREFPSYVSTVMTAPGDFPHRPRDRTPVFYGSFDWHSCVEMHWVLVRLLRLAAEFPAAQVPAAQVPAAQVPAAQITSVLDAQFTEEGLRAEAAFMATRHGARMERPYGWGWALTLMHELASWEDPNARRWAAAMEPLAEVLARNFLGWLPVATYPLRSGLHINSSFGLTRALPYARRLAGGGRPELADAITGAARRWYAADAGYPGGWEPSGHDFLSPALTEAELMACLLPRAEFAGWLTAFLPGIADGAPASLFTPALVADPGDGQIAHLHGLNLSRAWCWRRLAETLPPDDPRVAACADAARRHADASLPHVTGEDYMVGHWLAAYAVLLVS
jgi:Protein of unknown function (DUF2891)